MKDLAKFIEEQDRAVKQIKRINFNVGTRRASNGYTKGPNITEEELGLVKHFVLAFRLPCYLGGEGGFNQFVFKVYSPPIYPGIQIDTSCYGDDTILSTGSRDMRLSSDDCVKVFLSIYEIAGSNAFRETARVCGVRESMTLYGVFDMNYEKLDELRKDYELKAS